MHHQGVEVILISKPKPKVFTLPCFVNIHVRQPMADVFLIRPACIISHTMPCQHTYMYTTEIFHKHSIINHVLTLHMYIEWHASSP